jgi:hypothetical protein
MPTPPQMVSNVDIVVPANFSMYEKLLNNIEELGKKWMTVPDNRAAEF